MIPSNIIENDNDKLKIDNYEPKKTIKDPYVLEFLGLDTSNYKEKDLEGTYRIKTHSGYIDMTQTELVYLE